MSELETETNLYLFHEFGVEGDERAVSASWPFQLRRVAESFGQVVFEFEDEQPYFALGGTEFDVMPKAGMDVADLETQTRGSEWIAARDPVDLETSRPGDVSLPSMLERRKRLLHLADDACGEGALVLIGVYLRTEGRYIALVAQPGHSRALALGLESVPRRVEFPDAPSWRRLAWAVGTWLDASRDPGVG